MAFSGNQITRMGHSGFSRARVGLGQGIAMSEAANYIIMWRRRRRWG